MTRPNNTISLMLLNKQIFDIVIISEFEIRVFDRGSEVKSTSFSGNSPSSQITLPDLVYQRALQRTAGNIGPVMPKKTYVKLRLSSYPSV